MLGHFRIQIIHQHPQGCLLLPSLAGKRRPAWRADRLIGSGIWEGGSGHGRLLYAALSYRTRGARQQSTCGGETVCTPWNINAPQRCWLRSDPLASGQDALPPQGTLRYSEIHKAMNYPTIPQALLQALDSSPNPKLLRFKHDQRWESLSSSRFLKRIAAFSAALSQMGVVPGDRVALFSGNRPEWHIADFAVQGIGGVTVPIYFRESDERMEYILADSGAKILVAAGEAPIAQVSRIRQRCGGVAHVVVAGARERHTEFLDYAALISAGGEGAIEAYRKSASQISSRDLATIIYTSGTTGEPKGVMLSHQNLTSNALETFRAFEFNADDLALSFLPLAHVYERTMTYGYFFRGVPIAYLERPEELQEALREVRPTIVAAVPRVFEKIYANIIAQRQTLTGVNRHIFDWALSAANSPVPWRAYGRGRSPWMQLHWILADRLVYRKIRIAIGGRIRCFTSGSAPLEKGLAEFFWAIGIPVYEGYGLTETSPVVTANVPGQYRVGTTGKPIGGVEVRIAGDGEILVGGAGVMQGYYKKAEDTRAAFTADGFVLTGDIGGLDADGYLTVTDRKKELLKTAAGKFVSPQALESRVKTSPYIANAMVIGDRRKFVALLVVPNFAGVRAWSHEQGRPLSTNQQVATDADVGRLIAGEVSRLTANFATYEQPKRFAILDSEFTFEGGELTYTLKLRRRKIEEKFTDAIAQLYADQDEPRPPARIAQSGANVQQAGH
jgi:long-chain acyl-CoA synthetase